VRAVAVGGEVGHLVRQWRRGADGADEGEVPDAGLDENREGRRVGGEDVEVGGESEGRVGRGAQRAQAGADGDGEGPERVVGAVGESQRRAGGERGGEVEAEVLGVAARREAREEGQPQHGDWHLGAQQGAVVVAELDGRLHGGRAGS
jgi:hypothetical protein